VERQGLGVELNEHIGLVIEGMALAAEELGLAGIQADRTGN
jgi:predicted hydrolase (HD superfamily)